MFLLVLGGNSIILRNLEGGSGHRGGRSSQPPPRGGGGAGQGWVFDRCSPSPLLKTGPFRHPRYTGGDGKSWNAGYWQRGLGTLFLSGTLGTQAATGNPGTQAVGSGV